MTIDMLKDDGLGALVKLNNQQHPRQLFGQEGVPLDNSGQIIENLDNNPLDLSHHVVELLHAQPLFFCFTFGFLVYAILTYLFMLNEHEHIRENPKIQYHLDQLNEEENDFVIDRRKAYKDMMKKDRKERNKYLKEQKERKLLNMTQEKRIKHVEKHKKRRRNMMLEEEIKFQQALRAQSRPIETVEQMKKLRKMIHRDMMYLYKNNKNLLKKTEEEEQEEFLNESEDDLKNIETKIYYGSDSDGSYFEEYQKFLTSRQDSVIIDSAIQQILDEYDQNTTDSNQIDLEQQEKDIIDSNDDFEFGLIYRGRGPMNDPNSYGEIQDRIDFEIKYYQQKAKNNQAQGTANAANAPDAMAFEEEEKVQEQEEQKEEEFEVDGRLHNVEDYSEDDEEESEEEESQSSSQRSSLMDSSRDESSLADDNTEDQFDQDDDDDGENSATQTPRSSQRSTRVLEFDEDDQIVEKPARNRNSTLEMVDLREQRNEPYGGYTGYKGPANKVEITSNSLLKPMPTYSQKKRERRTKKREKELQEQAEREQRQKEKEAALKKKQRSSMLSSLADSEDADSQMLIKPKKKKQLQPKKLVTDEHGEEWEVIDKKKRVFVEVEEDNEDELEKYEERKE